MQTRPSDYAVRFLRSFLNTPAHCGLFTIMASCMLAKKPFNISPAVLRRVSSQRNPLHQIETMNINIETILLPVQLTELERKIAQDIVNTISHALILFDKVGQSRAERRKQLAALRVEVDRLEKDCDPMDGNRVRQLGLKREEVRMLEAVLSGEDVGQAERQLRNSTRSCRDDVSNFCESLAGHIVADIAGTLQPFCFQSGEAQRLAGQCSLVRTLSTRLATFASRATVPCAHSLFTELNELLAGKIPGGWLP